MTFSEIRDAQQTSCIHPYFMDPPLLSLARTHHWSLGAPGSPRIFYFWTQQNPREGLAGALQENSHHMKQINMILWMFGVLLHVAERSFWKSTGLDFRGDSRAEVLFRTFSVRHQKVGCRRTIQLQKAGETLARLGEIEILMDFDVSRRRSSHK